MKLNTIRFIKNFFFLFIVISLFSCVEVKNIENESEETSHSSKSSSSEYKNKNTQSQHGNSQSSSSSSASSGASGTMPPNHGGGTGEAHPSISAKVPKNSKILVPAIVKGHWKGVKLVIEDKRSASMKEYSVEIGDNLKMSIGNKEFDIGVEAFLPDFRIEENPEGPVYTSLSNNPENPAVKVHVFEDSKEIFNGWLFSLFPSMHPFQHGDIGITFKQGLIKK